MVEHCEWVVVDWVVKRKPQDAEDEVMDGLSADIRPLRVLSCPDQASKAALAGTKPS